jgi:hypothetical protein
VLHKAKTRVVGEEKGVLNELRGRLELLGAYLQSFGEELPQLLLGQGLQVKNLGKAGVPLDLCLIR